MNESKKIALGGMMAALSIVLLLAGSAIGIGTYAAPMLAAPLLSPVGRAMGKKYHVLLWIAVSLLGFLLIPDMEQDLMYFGVFGCYPIIRPFFEKQKKGLGLALKLVYFNTVVVALEALLLFLLVPESMSAVMAVILLVMGNVVFLCYDRLIPRMEGLLCRYLKGWMG
ncbi:MAG: hypothetical protein IJX71_03800 [Oscillospiraceae bacterium]|nr:hypothetical protein [Oscillospiraceae bacterium]